jgi:hypothetical protein
MGSTPLTVTVASIKSSIAHKTAILWFLIVLMLHDRTFFLASIPRAIVAGHLVFGNDWAKFIGFICDSTGLSYHNNNATRWPAASRL